MEKQFPIEQSESGFWVVWSMPIEHTIGGEVRAKGLITFPSYEKGNLECSKRNLEFVKNNGIADKKMTASDITYREYYEIDINSLKEIE